MIIQKERFESIGISSLFSILDDIPKIVYKIASDGNTGVLKESIEEKCNQFFHMHLCLITASGLGYDVYQLKGTLH